jgi:hypothetical protein
MRHGPGRGGAGGGLIRIVSSLGSRVSSYAKTRNDRIMTDESFKDFVLDQLQELDGIEARRMFGGHGLYQDETFFAILHKGKLYL